jgi:hypothetical protein
MRATTFIPPSREQVEADLELYQKIADQIPVTSLIQAMTVDEYTPWGPAVDGKSLFSGSLAFFLCNTKGVPLDLLLEMLVERQAGMNIMGWIGQATKAGWGARAMSISLENIMNTLYPSRSKEEIGDDWKKCMAISLAYMNYCAAYPEGYSPKPHQL